MGKEQAFLSVTFLFCLRNEAHVIINIKYAVTRGGQVTHMGLLLILIKNTEFSSSGNITDICLLIPHVSYGPNPDSLYPLIRAELGRLEVWGQGAEFKKKKGKGKKGSDRVFRNLKKTFLTKSYCAKLLCTFHVTISVPNTARWFDCC